MGQRCLQNRALSMSFSSVNPFKQATTQLQEIVAKDIVETNDHSELPDSFDDMVQRAASRIVSVINSGSTRIRVDIDTAVGDLTYTTIKNTLPVMKGLAEQLSVSLDLSLPIPMQPEENIESESKELAISEEMLQETMKNTFTPEKTMTIFFPDMGAAVLARRDWKFGTAFPDVPPCVYTANMQNDGLKPTDKLAVVFCPKYSETEAVKRIMDMCDEAAIPCLLVNPDLINMDQGYGVRARNIRKAILGTFTTAYKLQTLKLGAVVREWSKGYSVWFEDTSKEEGYALLKSYSSDPTRETIDELFTVAEEAMIARDGKKNEKKTNQGKNVVNEMIGFFKGLSKL